MGGPGLIAPDWPDAPPGIGALTTGRCGGASAAPYDDGAGGGGFNLGLHVGDDPAAVARNRARLAQALPGRPRWLAQVHGVAVADAGTIEPGLPAPAADAAFATGRGVVCAVLTADCLPVLLASTDGQVVAAAHAGWRGLAAGVLGTTVATMRAAGAGEIVAWLGPAIGARCFEVGEDVRAIFLAQAGIDRGAVAAAFEARDRHPGKYLADINALARLALARDGVLRVAGGNDCTASAPARFYSYRRDGVTGRQASLIWIA